MCFAVNQANKAELDKQLWLWPQGKTPLVGWTPSRWMDGFSHPHLPVILSDGVCLAQWGLVPAWFKHDHEAQAFQNKTLNARGETLYDLPSFKDAAATQRCLVPVNAFYEYQHRNALGQSDPEGKKSQPYRLFIPDRPVFYLGGLWALWRERLTFTIVTIPANPLMEVIHNTKKRMPLIVPDDEAQAWLTGGKAPTFEQWLAPRDDLGLQAEETEGKSAKGEDRQGMLF